MLLRSGEVFVAGGTDDNGTVLDTAEIYDPAANTWTKVDTTTMGDERTGAGAALLPGTFYRQIRPFISFPAESVHWMRRQMLHMMPTLSTCDRQARTTENRVL